MTLIGPRIVVAHFLMEQAPQMITEEEVLMYIPKPLTPTFQTKALFYS